MSCRRHGQTASLWEGVTPHSGSRLVSTWNPEDRGCKGLSRTEAECGSSNVRTWFGAGVLMRTSKAPIQESVFGCLGSRDTEAG